MEIEMRVAKDIRGNWRADSYIDLESGMTMKIVTRKTYSGNVITDVSVGITKDNMFTHAPFSDFTETITVMTKGRATQNNVTRQHMESLKKIPEIKERCKAFYAAKTV